MAVDELDYNASVDKYSVSISKFLSILQNILNGHYDYSGVRNLAILTEYIRAIKRQVNYLDH